MNDCQYIRVGTQYFKIVSFPLLSGDLTERMIPWNYDTIRHDMGASFISSIPKYNGFCVTPSHNNYKRTIGDYLNRYQPIEHMLRKGSILYTEKFLRHLFEEQFELELDYLTSLFIDESAMIYKKDELRLRNFRDKILSKKELFIGMEIIEKTKENYRFKDLINFNTNDLEK